MKNIILSLIALTALAAPTVAATVPPSRSMVGIASTDNKQASKTTTVTYNVSLNCHRCKAKLEKHIPFEKGVKDMEVDVDKKQVTVTFDNRKNTVEGIAKAIEKLGYTVEVAE